MGQQIPIRSSAVIAGQEIILETGKLAALADGSDGSIPVAPTDG